MPQPAFGSSKQSKESTKSKTQPPDFTWRPIILSLYGPALLFGQGQGAIITVIALTAHQLGASYAISGLIVTLVGIGLFVGNIPATLLVSKFGERSAMIAASVFSALGMVFCLSALNLWILGIGVLMQGVSTSVFNLARQAYMIQAVPFQLRARAFSVMGGVQRIGFFIGPFLAAPSMYFFDLSGAYYVGILTISITIIFCYLAPELPAYEPAVCEKGKVVKPESSSGLLGMWQQTKAFKRLFLIMGTAVMLLTALRAVRPVILPLWAAHMAISPATMSLIFSVSSAVDMIVFYPAGKIMDEKGRGWVAIPCVTLLGLSFILMAMSHSILGFVLAALLMGFANGIGAGIVMTLGADYAPDSARIEFLGVWRLITDSGHTIGPLMLSLLVMVTSLATGVFVTGLFGFLAGWVFIREFFLNKR